METTDTFTTYLPLAMALGIPVIGLMAWFMELHAQAQPQESWWHDCRRPIQWVGRTSTAMSVALFAAGAVMLWGNA